MGRCRHGVLIIDSFIEGGGAFASCIFCPTSVEISSDALQMYIPFHYNSGKGPEADQDLIVHTRYLPEVK